MALYSLVSAPGWKPWTRNSSRDGSSVNVSSYPARRSSPWLMEDEVPALLRREVEELWRGDVAVEARRPIHGVKARSGSVRPFREARVHHAVRAAARDGARVHVQAVAKAYDRRVLHGDDVVGFVARREQQRARGRPGQVERKLVHAPSDSRRRVGPARRIPPAPRVSRLNRERRRSWTRSRDARTRARRNDRIRT